MTTSGLSTAAGLHRWGLPRGLIVLLGGAAMVIIVAGIQGVAWLIGPAFMALIVVIAVAPAQSWLRRRGWPAWATTLVVVLLVYAILIGFALGIILSIAQLGTQIPQYAAKADGLVGSLTTELSKLGVGPDQLRQAANSLDLGKLTGLIGGLLASVAGLASNLVFLLSLLLFLSIESGSSGERLASVAADRPPIAAALAHFAWGTRQYLAGHNGLRADRRGTRHDRPLASRRPTGDHVGASGVHHQLHPQRGIHHRRVPPAVLALLAGGPQLMVIVIIVYCAINFVVQSIIQLRFIGDAVELSVTVTFLALVFWAWLIGPLGAILAIPLTLLAKAMLVDVDPHAGWADASLRASATKPESPAADATATAEGTPSATELAGAASPTSSQAEGSLPSEPRVHDPHVT